MLCTSSDQTLTEAELAEGPHQLFGIDWTNAPDHPGGEIFLDAIGRSGGRIGVGQQRAMSG
jgi:hypothetical protein